MAEAHAFDILIKVIIYLSWAAIILGPLSLIGLRLYYFLTSKQVFKEKWLLLLLPLSIGIELYVPKSRFKIIYRTVLIVFFVFFLLHVLFKIYILL